MTETISVQYPGHLGPEMDYIFSHLLASYWDVEFELIVDDRISEGPLRRSPYVFDQIKISCGPLLRKILFPCHLLTEISRQSWAAHSNEWQWAVEWLDLTTIECGKSFYAHRLPLVSRTDWSPITSRRAVDANQIIYDFDLFGSILFFLSRVEELGYSKDRDAFGRFRVETSLMHKHGFIKRPVVNEYVRLLLAILNTGLGTSLKEKPRQFRIACSHDIDRPFRFYGRTNAPKEIGRQAIRALRRKANWSASLDIIGRGLAKLAGRETVDPYWVFDKIMNLSDEFGLVSQFNFPAVDGTGAESDLGIWHDSLIALAETIVKRGHTIGFHPSLTASSNPIQFQDEAQLFLAGARRMGLHPKDIGGRYHYLKWTGMQSWRNWSNCNFGFDASIGWHNSVGFRAGTCYEYPVYDVERRQTMPIIERPLVAMDCALLHASMSGPEREDAMRQALVLRDCCKYFEGNFEILWHNSWLNIDAVEWDFYAALIR